MAPLSIIASLPHGSEQLVPETFSRSAAELAQQSILPDALLLMDSGLKMMMKAAGFALYPATALLAGGSSIQFRRFQSSILSSSNTRCKWYWLQVNLQAII